MEHAFVRIEKDMKSGNIPGVVLLCGREEYLTDHYKRTLAERFIHPAASQMDLTILSNDEITAENLEDIRHTIPLMSERKVTVIDRLINTYGRYPVHLERSENALKELLDIIADIREDSLIIITAERAKSTGDGRKQSDGRKLEKIRKLIESAGGRVYDFGTLEQGQLRSFIIKRMQSAGKSCSRDVLHRFMFDTGYESRHSEYDLYLLENDIKKAIAHSGNRQMITMEDLESTLSVSPENNVFHMLDAMSRERKDQALIDLDMLLSDGVSEFAILSNIVRQLEIMLIAKELMDENNSSNQAVNYLVKEEKVGKFRAQKIPRTASRFNTGQLKNMLCRALTVEEHIKGGLMGPRLALEYFIVER